MPLRPMVSVPRRGFVVFLPYKGLRLDFATGARFQSPEGDSLFFYEPLGNPSLRGEIVSVPRRGFVVFLPGSLVSCLEAKAEFDHVSVPRRGFVVFLPSLPRDSL